MNGVSEAISFTWQIASSSQAPHRNDDPFFFFLIIKIMSLLFYSIAQLLAQLLLCGKSRLTPPQIAVLVKGYNAKKKKRFRIGKLSHYLANNK